MGKSSCRSAEGQFGVKYEPEEQEALSRRAGRLSSGHARVIPCPPSSAAVSARAEAELPFESPSDCDTGVSVSMDGAAPNGQNDPADLAPTPQIPAEIADTSARHRRFELLTYGSGVAHAPLAPLSSPSQTLGNVQDRNSTSVQVSQPFAPFSSPFAAPVLQRKRRRGLRLVDGHPERALLPVREVAKLLGVCTAIVYELVANGELAHVRVSNSIRVAPPDLEAYLAARRRRRDR